MRINRRFNAMITVTIFLFILWLLFYDDLLLSLWIGLLAVISFSWVVSKTSLTSIDLNRFSSKKILEIGNIFDERLEIKNNSRLMKYWIEIIDRSELLEKINSRVITGLGPKKVGIFQSTVVLNKRGFFSLGPTELISGDPFGLFTVSKTFNTKNHLLVYPKVNKLSRVPLLPADKAGSAFLMLQTTHTTPQAAGVREYTPGDPLSRVHWPATIRHDKLMVKEFDEDSQSSIWIILDAQKEKYYRTVQEKTVPAFDRNFISIKKTKEYFLPRDSFEYAVSTAASLTKYFLAKNLSVGLACAGERLSVLPPEKGLRQLNKILEGLATVKDVGKTPLEQLIEKQSKNISKGSAVILITAPRIENHETFMETLRRKGFHVMKIVLDNASFIKDNEKSVGSNIDPSGSVIKILFGDDIGKVLSVN